MVDPIQYQARKQIFEEAVLSASASADRFNTVQRQVLDHHVSFFEKLALFNTGTIAATITMAVALRQHGQMQWKDLLFAGWIALLLGMALFLLRNWSTHSHLYYTALASYQGKRALQVNADAAFQSINPGLLLNELGEKRKTDEYVLVQSANAKELEDIANKFSERSDKDFSRLRVSEISGLISTIAGIISILVFTIRNFA